MTKTPWGNAEELRSRRLPPGPGTPPDEVKRSQRERLLAATVAAVATHGYAATRVADVLALSGVSRSAFYKHFGDKRECFLATFDAIAEIAAQAIADAHDSDLPWDQRLRAVLDAVVTLASDQPAAAQLVLVDAYAAGPEAIARLDRIGKAAERMLSDALAESPERSTMPDEVVRAIVGGITTTMRRRLARGREADLRSLVSELLDWALSYRPFTVPLRAGPPPPPDEPEAPARSDQEQRLIAALAQELPERGYSATTIADIAERAGVSLTTFYACFAGKQDALLAVLDHVRAASVEAMDARERAPSWPTAVHTGLERLLAMLDDQPAFVGVALLEPGVDDPRARDHGYETLALDEVLAPDRPDAPEVPRTDAEAIGGAILALIAARAPSREDHAMHELTPVATYVALSPFVGPAQACAVANSSA